MHADVFIKFLLDTMDHTPKALSGQASYSQVLSSDLLTTIIQNCGTAFRSKFVITLEGIVRILTLIDGLLESQQGQILDTSLEMV